MLTSSEINEVKFSKSMGGYSREEVELFLEKVISDYAQFERIIRECKEENRKLNNELNELKESHDSIQSVLLSAQGLADSIVNEAKEKSEIIIHNAEMNITAISQREKELSEAFELRAQERRESLEKELSEMVRQAKIKADSITAAANDSVARQQMLFDKLKLEISVFKSAINAKYKEHLEILSQLPDSVPNDPNYLAEAVSAVYDKAPAPETFVAKPETIPTPKPIVPPVEENSNESQIVSEPEAVIEEEEETGFNFQGFTINQID